jgi:hypothetical protein
LKGRKEQKNIKKSGSGDGKAAQKKIFLNKKRLFN